MTFSLKWPSVAKMCFHFFFCKKFGIIFQLPPCHWHPPIDASNFSRLLFRQTQLPLFSLFAMPTTRGGGGGMLPNPAPIPSRAQPNHPPPSSELLYFDCGCLCFTAMYFFFLLPSRTILVMFFPCFRLILMGSIFLFMKTQIAEVYL